MISALLNHLYSDRRGKVHIQKPKTPQRSTVAFKMKGFELLNGLSKSLSSGLEERHAMQNTNWAVLMKPQRFSHSRPEIMPPSWLNVAAMKYIPQRRSLVVIHLRGATKSTTLSYTLRENLRVCVITSTCGLGIQSRLTLVGNCIWKPQKGNFPSQLGRK